MARSFLAVIFCTWLAAGPALAQPTDPADIAFWDSIKNSTNPAEHRAYLETFPQGRFASLAKLRLEAAGHDVLSHSPTAPTTTIRPVGPLSGKTKSQLPAPPEAAGPATTPGRMDAMALSKEAYQLKRPGMFAKYRGEAIEIQGRFQRMADTGIGDMVGFDFILPQGFDNPKGFTIRCQFPRRDLRAYDLMNAMKIGTGVLVRGQVFDVSEHSQTVYMKPCAILQPALHPASDAVATIGGPTRPPYGAYVCTTYNGVKLRPPIRILDDLTFEDSEGTRRTYRYDQASGRVDFQGRIYGESYSGKYNFPSAPIAGGTGQGSTITITPASGGASMLCELAPR